ncbi:MAG: murein biosynthesis integral membrane protein MurJ, partial [Elusimicrobia bacterium]|nr:murein biosynthesis integral membrane protein MurJ [Elusimicrobiota bacterium]
MSQEKQLTKHAGRVAMGTMVSRILGYIRDMLVAHVFGAGLAADAFYAAYRIPNLFRRLLGEGSLSASFIPVLSEYVSSKTKEETQELINVVFTALTLVLTVLMILGMIFAPQIVNVVAYGFTSNPDKFELTVNLTRLMFPFLLFICLAALLLGIAN